MSELGDLLTQASQTSLIEKAAVTSPLVSGQQICLMPFNRRHLEQTRIWFNDADLARLLGRYRPVSDLEHERWFEKLHEQKDCLYFAIETQKSRFHIGNVWLWEIDWRHRKAELRILIGSSDRLGQGMGSEAIGLACTYFFQCMNMHKVYAYVLSSNPRALKAFERAGFKVEGTLKDDRWADGSYVDVYILGKFA